MRVVYWCDHFFSPMVLTQVSSYGSEGKLEARGETTGKFLKPRLFSLRKRPFLI